MNNVKLQGRIYKQVIGMPMGCDCAPQVAELFFYWYEHDYISRGVTDNKNIFSQFKYGSRYIEVLNIPNCNQDFCNVISKDIYPDGGVGGPVGPWLLVPMLIII